MITNKSAPFIPYLEAILAVSVWGASFIATKIAVQQAAPVTVVWLRFGLGLLVLGTAVLARRQAARPALKELAYFAVLGAIGITFHQWLQSTGLLTANATTTSWLVATSPIFIALLGWLALKEGLSWVQGLGIALAALGVLLVVTKGDLGSLARGRFGAPGDFLVMISAPNWAVFSILSRRGLRKFPATQMMFYVMGFGWLFSTLLFLAGAGTGSAAGEIGRLDRDGWLAVLFLGIFCSGLAYIFWYDALQALPVAQSGAFLYVEPFVTVIVAAIVLGEPLLPAAMAGGAIILLGVWLVQQRPA